MSSIENYLLLSALHFVRELISELNLITRIKHARQVALAAKKASADAVKNVSTMYNEWLRSHDSYFVRRPFHKDISFFEHRNSTLRDSLFSYNKRVLKTVYVRGKQHVIRGIIKPNIDVEYEKTRLSNCCHEGIDQFSCVVSFVGTSIRIQLSRLLLASTSPTLTFSSLPGGYSTDHLQKLLISSLFTVRKGLVKPRLVCVV